LIVVSDTSPILNLDRIGRIDLLPQLFGQVVVPTTVFQELSKLPNRSYAFPWLTITSAVNQELVTSLRMELDPGESEAIVLAQELNADILLIDERRGRRVASRYGLNFTGLLGILAQAKARSLIPHVGPILEELQTVANFWISPGLKQEFLELLGEM